MKRFHLHWYGLVAVTVIMLSRNANTQAPKPTEKDSKTQIEAFQAQTGTVIIKGYSAVGSVKGTGSVSVDCMELINATTGQKQMGVVLEVTEGGRFERSSRSIVDYDEIEPLLSGIDYLSKLTGNCTKLSNFEGAYVTGGTLKIAVFNDESGQIRAAVTSGNVGPVSAYISMFSLSDLRTFVTKAKKQLDDIR